MKKSGSSIDLILTTYLLTGSGRLAAARKLLKEVPFSQLSLRKTKSILGRSVDVSVELDNSDDEADVEIQMGRSTRSRRMQSRPRTRSSSARRARQERELLIEQSSEFRDLESLIKALDVMESWRSTLNQKPE